MSCEPCQTTGACLQFPFVFYNLSAGKSYSNPLLSFVVACPDGTTQTVYIPSGTINYTLPFPPGFTGPYPPLVLGCAAGGNIARTIPNNATQDEIDSIVNEMLSVCAQALAQAKVTCKPANVTNDQVVYNFTCPVGQTPSFTGTPPTWITWDQANSRLVGAANTFTGTTVQGATATAQNALDTYAALAISNLQLTCSMPIPPCVADHATINVSANPNTVTASTDAAVQRAIVNDRSNTTVTFINTQTNAVITSHAIFASDTAQAYCETTQTFWFSDSSAVPADSTILIYDKDGNFVNSVSVTDSILGLVYSPEQDKLYAATFVAGNAHIKEIDPHTLAVVDTDLGASAGGAPAIVYSPNRLWLSNITFTGNPNPIDVFNLPALTHQGTWDIGAGGLTNVVPLPIQYAPNTGKMCASGYTPITFDLIMVEIDPATLAQTSSVAFLNGGDVPDALTYDITRGEVITGAHFANLELYDPTTHTFTCSVASNFIFGGFATTPAGSTYVPSNLTGAVHVYN